MSHYFDIYDLDSVNGFIPSAATYARSSDYGVLISGEGVWNAPARRGSSISVPGKNGDIWVDDGNYDNIIVTYPCYIADDFAGNIDDFRSVLAAHSDAYYALVDSYHPDMCRSARYAGPLTAEPGTRNEVGHFNVSFECKPYYFYTYSTISAGSTTSSYITKTITSPDHARLPGCFHISVAAYNPNKTYPASFEISLVNGDYSETIYMTNIPGACSYDSGKDTFKIGSSYVAGDGFYTTGKIYLPVGTTTVTVTRTDASGLYIAPAFYSGEVKTLFPIL